MDASVVAGGGDARRSRERVMQGARQTFAARGFGASYHEIARTADVGVGTVYRCFPDRDELFEAVLCDILDTLVGAAEAAGVGNQAWESFADFFVELSGLMRRHAGLTERLENRGGERVAAARERLLRAFDVLCERMKLAGLREDVSRQHVLYLAQAAAADGCGLDPAVNEDHRAQAVDFILRGLKR